MKEFMMEYWLTILVSVYLLGMTIYGHYRGFIRIAVSVSALIVSLFIVKVGTPYVTGYLKDNTALHHVVQEKILSMSGFQTEEEHEDTMPADQRQLIEGLNLPEPLKEALIENNNSEVYQLLGVNIFAEYVGNYLSNMIYNLIAFVILFIIAFIIIRVLMSWLNLFARLPIISGINQIAGAIMGALEGLAVIWLLSLVITIFSTTEWGRIIIAQIEISPWLSFLYRNNIFQWIAMGVLKRIV